MTSVSFAQLRAPSPSPSDPRATFFVGNVTTCANIGFPSDIQVGGPGNKPVAGDINVIGTVTTNSGTVHPGEGQEVNVTLLNPNAVISAVVVKGGPAYNVYPFLTPPPQHYISPFNGGGNVPGISHWFACYHLATPAGTLTVSKVVVSNANGIPVTPLPTTYTASVSCSDGRAATVTFDAGGGEGTAVPPLTGFAVTTPPVTCRVIENTASLPAGTVVTYSPTTAPTSGVPITGSAGVHVSITNDFSAVEVETGTVQLNKVVFNPHGVAGPAHFTAQVVCNDGVTNAVVTMPGTGGVGSPVLHPRVGFACALEETSIPSGWTATYSVNGGPLSPALPTFPISSATQTVSVTIVNGAPGTTPPESGGGEPGVAPEAPTSPESPTPLPVTG